MRGERAWCWVVVVVVVVRSSARSLPQRPLRTTRSADTTTSRRRHRHPQHPRCRLIWHTALLLVQTCCIRHDVDALSRHGRPDEELAPSRGFTHLAGTAELSMHCRAKQKAVGLFVDSLVSWTTMTLFGAMYRASALLDRELGRPSFQPDIGHRVTHHHNITHGHLRPRHLSPSF
jgi:hypothetical protein